MIYLILGISVRYMGVSVYITWGGGRSVGRFLKILKRFTKYLSSLIAINTGEIVKVC